MCLSLETEVHILWYSVLFLEASTNLQNIWFYLTLEGKYFIFKGNNVHFMYSIPVLTLQPPLVSVFRSLPCQNHLRSFSQCMTLNQKTCFQSKNDAG